jgi:hypothetical protein
VLINFFDEESFLAAVAQLADAAERVDPVWARLLREHPSVYVPHRPYGKQPGALVRSGVGCCEFPLSHPVHTDPWEQTPWPQPGPELAAELGR